jgi:hypothetical protein
MKFVKGILFAQHAKADRGCAGRRPAEGAQGSGRDEPFRSELSMTPVEEERATPAALARLLKAEIDKWDRIIKNAGITPQ